jgi:hypothetical protein
MTLPAAEDDGVVAFSRDATTPTSIASTLSQLTTSMQRAVSGMSPDDRTLEVDASPDRPGFGCEHLGTATTADRVRKMQHRPMQRMASALRDDATMLERIDHLRRNYTLDHGTRL